MSDNPFEVLNLPPSLRGRSNPKSTTGRLDIFTRIVTDNTPRGPQPRVRRRSGESTNDWYARDRETGDRYEKARAALDAGSFQAALATFTDIQRGDPDYPEVAALAARGETAEELVRRLEQDELANVIYTYGEERRSRSSFPIRSWVSEARWARSPRSIAGRGTDRWSPWSGRMERPAPIGSPR